MQRNLQRTVCKRLRPFGWSRIRHCRGNNPWRRRRSGQLHKRRMSKRRCRPQTQRSSLSRRRHRSQWHTGLEGRKSMQCRLGRKYRCLCCTGCIWRNWNSRSIPKSSRDMQTVLSDFGMIQLHMDERCQRCSNCWWGTAERETWWLLCRRSK